MKSSASLAVSVASSTGVGTSIRELAERVFDRTTDLKAGATKRDFDDTIGIGAPANSTAF